jgi:hypothetical protein
LQTAMGSEATGTLLCDLPLRAGIQVAQLIF